jgi:hypothetical protein
MFSPNVKLDANSELRKAIDTAARRLSKRWANAGSSVGVFGVHVAMLGAVLALTDHLHLTSWIVAIATQRAPSAADGRPGITVAAVFVVVVSTFLVMCRACRIDG